MSTLLPSVEPFARTIATIASDAIWEDVVILLVIAGLLRILRSQSAATRYAAWLVALAACVAMPVTTALSLNTTAALGSRSPIGAARSTGSTKSLPTAYPRAAVAPSVARSTVVIPSVARSAKSRDELGAIARPSVTLPDPALLAIASLCLVISLGLVGRLGAGLVKLERLKGKALPLPLEYRDALGSLTEARSTARDVRLCLSDETEVPVAVGLFDAMVLLPRRLLETLSPEELEQVCLHEIAHLRRCDDWTNLFQRTAAALFWFSPAVYAIARAMDVEREAACDDDVVSHIGAVRPYAQCLTKLAEVTMWPHRALAAPGVFVTRRGISERIERLLRAGRNAARGLALGPAAGTMALLAALGFIMQAVAPTLAAPLAGARASSGAHGTHARERVAVASATPQAAATRTRAAIRTRAISVPARHAQARQGRIPARHLAVQVPAVDVSIPPIDVNVPGVHVDIPSVDFTIPAMRFHVPNVARAFHSPSCRSACDFSHVNWPHRDFRGQQFSATDFSDARLAGADFSHATLQAVDFSDTDLRDARFVDAKLAYVDFSDARLDGADFNGATIDVCDFSGVDLSHIDLSKAKLGGLCRLSIEHGR